jgi:hypothetical protein
VRENRVDLEGVAVAVGMGGSLDRVDDVGIIWSWRVENRGL